MLRRCVSAAVVLIAVAGLVLAKEYKGVITKMDVDGKKITFKAEGSDKEKTLTYTDDTKFYFSFKGEAKEVPAKFLSKMAEKGFGDKGRPATIETDKDDKNVAKVTFTGGGKKKKDKDK
jgi:hypothetical protein